MMICEEKKPDFKKIITNTNMIAILFGIFLFLAQISLPGPVDSAVRSLGSMIGPLKHADLRNADCRNHAPGNSVFSPYWTCHDSAAHRCTVLTILLLKFSGNASFAENGSQILLVTLLATITPSASTITQMKSRYMEKMPAMLVPLT